MGLWEIDETALPVTESHARHDQYLPVLCADASNLDGRKALRAKKVSGSQRVSASLPADEGTSVRAWD